MTAMDDVHGCTSVAVARTAKATKEMQVLQEQKPVERRLDPENV